jgi:hypothetical protein
MGDSDGQTTHQTINGRGKGIVDEEERREYEMQESNACRFWSGDDWPKLEVKAANHHVPGVHNFNVRQRRASVLVVTFEQ